MDEQLIKDIITIVTTIASIILYFMNRQKASDIRYYSDTNIALTKTLEKSDRELYHTRQALDKSESQLKQFKRTI